MAKKYPNLGSILKKLLFDYNISETDLAKGVGLPQPTINRIVTGKSSRPYESSLKLIAKYFSISIEQLLGEKPLKEVQKEENFQKKNFYWPAEKNCSLSFVNWHEIDDYNKKQFERSVPFLGEINEQGFATIMPDSSMEPLIKEGSMLIFDPLSDCIDGSLVLSKIKESNSYLVRQLIYQHKERFLVPLNPRMADDSIVLKNEDLIIANLIEIRHNLKNNYSNKGYIRENI